MVLETSAAMASEDCNGSAESGFRLPEVKYTKLFINGSFVDAVSGRQNLLQRFQWFIGLFFFFFFKEKKTLNLSLLSSKKALDFLTDFDCRNAG